MVELAVVEQDVRVRVRGDGERALTDAGADQRPRLPLPMPETDSAVAEVVWGPSGRPRGPAGAGDRRSQPLLGEAGNDGSTRAAVVTRRQRGDDGGEELGSE